MHEPEDAKTAGREQLQVTKSTTTMIKTDRLSIRRVIAEDWKAMQQIWTDISASPYAKYDNPKDTDEALVRSRIERWASVADSMEHIFFAVCLQDTMIGYVSLNRRSDSYELGYGFHSNYHGQGYAKESLSAIIKWMTAKGTSCITAGTALANEPSVRLLLSLGFQQTGTEDVSFWQDAAGNDIVFKGGVFSLQTGRLCGIMTI